MNDQTHNQAKSLAEDAFGHLFDIVRLLNEKAPCSQVAERVGDVKTALSSLGEHLRASHLEEAAAHCDPNDPEAVARLRAEIESLPGRARGWRLPEA